MSAVTEYYGYLLSQGYGEHQLKQFAEYAQRANRGEISHNRAYRLACKAGFGGYSNMTEQDANNQCESRYNTDSEVKSCVDELLNDENKKGSFGDWMKTAQDSGWIDKGLGILGGFMNKNPQGTSQGGNYYQQPPPKNNTALYVVGGLAVVGIGVAIYFAVRKKK